MSRERHVRDAVDRFVARVKLDTDVRLQALASELADLLGADGGDSAAVEIARAAARGAAQGRGQWLDVVVDGVRRIDDATTLRGILDALADGAAAAVPRVTILLVDSDSLRLHRHHGFPAGLAPGDVHLEAAGDLAHAVALRQPVRILPAVGRTPISVPHALAPAAGRLGCVLPIVVDGHVVAVLHAEGHARQASEPAEPVWLQQIELLGRHAAARLESVTSRRMVEVLDTAVGS